MARSASILKSEIMMIQTGIRFAAVVGFLLCQTVPSLSAGSSAGGMDIRAAWEIPPAPATFDAAPIQSFSPLIRALFFEGLPYRGKPTRVFAWMGIPAEAGNGPVPGIVLVHGGKGTAFEDWVKLWVDRGYAAIAMDTCGALPVPADADPRPRPEHAGPPGWGGFGQINESPSDQWAYHGVGAILAAHSLLRAQPGVDPARIGITGISWGGFLTCLAAANDPRFAFAAPVYGCGFLDRTVFSKRLRGEAGDASDRWMALWDPSHHLARVRAPMLWINGTNDGFFYPPAWQASHRLVPSKDRTLALLPNLPHNQQTASALKEVGVFADSIVRGGRPLPRFTSFVLEGGGFTARFEGRVERAEIVWTKDTGPWPKRKWQVQPVPVGSDTITANIPPEADFVFLNLIDEGGCTVSSEMAGPLVSE